MPYRGQDLYVPFAVTVFAAAAAAAGGGGSSAAAATAAAFPVSQRAASCLPDLYTQAAGFSAVCSPPTAAAKSGSHGGRAAGLAAAAAAAAPCELPFATAATRACNATCAAAVAVALCPPVARCPAPPACWSGCSAATCAPGYDRVWVPAEPGPGSGSGRFVCWSAAWRSDAAYLVGQAEGRAAAGGGGAPVGDVTAGVALVMSMAFAAAGAIAGHLGPARLAGAVRGVLGGGGGGGGGGGVGAKAAAGLRVLGGFARRAGGPAPAPVVPTMPQEVVRDYHQL